MDNIREEQLLGSKKLIIGKPNMDIVLESLGNIYLKLGKSLKRLDQYVQTANQVASQSDNEILSDILIYTENDLDNYPGDGKLVFVSDTGRLYITLNNNYLQLLQLNSSGDFVKITGDTMTGPLRIDTDLTPLIVRSRNLINNFNAELHGGYTSDEVAVKARDEKIRGEWTYVNDTHFYGKMNSFSGKLGTDNFVSGYTGQGWQLDSDTNTLTIDTLWVRKMMHVYELIVNKISALNGNFWVTNFAKCTKVWRVMNSKYLAEGELLTDEETNSALKNNKQTDEDFKGTDQYYYDSTSEINNTNFIGNCNDIAYIDDGGNVNHKIFNIIDSDYDYTYLNTLIDISLDSTDEARYSRFNSERPLHTIYNQILEAEVYDGSTFKNIYNTYFKGGLVYIISFDDLPTLKAGDIVRCQKLYKKNIKYYDALILNELGDKYIIQLSNINYNADELYKNYNDSDNVDLLFGPTPNDVIVQIGNIYNVDRQGSIYMTNSDQEAPYIDILEGINTPDFSNANTKEPKYIKIKTNQGEFYKAPLDAEDNPYYVGIAKENGDIVYSASGDDYYKVYTNPIYKDKVICEVGQNTQYVRHTKVRLGKLDGIRDSTFPSDKQPYGFGLYGSNVFLTGEFYLNNGSSVVDFAQNGVFLKFKNAGLSITEEDSTTETWIAEVYPKYANASLVKDIGYSSITFGSNNLPKSVTYKNTTYSLSLMEESTNVYQANINLNEDEWFILVRRGSNSNKQNVVALSADKIKVTNPDGSLASVFSFDNGKAIFNTDLIKAQELQSKNSVTSIYGFTDAGEFKTYYSAQSIYLWSLRSDGYGNLAGGNIRWDIHGNLDIRSTIHAGTGDIAEMYLTKSRLWLQSTEDYAKNNEGYAGYDWYDYGYPSDSYSYLRGKGYLLSNGILTLNEAFWGYDHTKLAKDKTDSEKVIMESSPNIGNDGLDNNIYTKFMMHRFSDITNINSWLTFIDDLKISDYSQETSQKGSGSYLYRGDVFPYNNGITITKYGVKQKIKGILLSHDLTILNINYVPILLKSQTDNIVVRADAVYSGYFNNASIGIFNKCTDKKGGTAANGYTAIIGLDNIFDNNPDFAEFFVNAYKKGQISIRVIPIPSMIIEDSLSGQTATAGDGTNVNLEYWKTVDADWNLKSSTSQIMLTKFYNGYRKTSLCRNLSYGNSTNSVNNTQGIPVNCRLMVQYGTSASNSKLHINFYGSEPDHQLFTGIGTTFGSDRPISTQIYGFRFQDNNNNYVGIKDVRKIQLTNVLYNNVRAWSDSYKWYDSSLFIRSIPTGNLQLENVGSSKETRNVYLNNHILSNVADIYTYESFNNYIELFLADDDTSNYSGFNLQIIYSE